MIINHNLAANNAIRSANSNATTASKSMSKLSSGLRINSAADDAAGLAISEKMRGQIRGLDQASSNAQDGISEIQTAEGALSETTSILQRMRELAVQSATDTNTTDDRQKIQTETDELAKEITRISNTTEFNTQNLLAGGLDNTFQIGANKGQQVTLQIGAMDAFSLGVAASKISTTLTPANGVSGISQVTTDLGAGAKVEVLNVNVATTIANAGNIGGAISTTGSDYTGSMDKTISYKVTAMNGATTTQVDSIQLSTDGGNTYTGATINRDGSGNFVLESGVQIQIANDAGNAIGDASTVDLTAKTVDLKLKNDAGDIGTAVTVRSNQNSVDLGSTTTDQTAKITFTFSALTAGNITVSQASLGSTKATINATGGIANEAVVQKGINVSTQTSANNAIETINTAITTVSSERSKLGAYQNRFEHTIANLGTSSENLTSAESRIRDVDMAKEMSTFSKNNILSQAAQAMLAQANQQPQQVLQLLR